MWKKILVSQYCFLFLILHWCNLKKASSGVKPKILEKQHCVRKYLGFLQSWYSLEIICALVCFLFQRRPPVPDRLSSGWWSLLPGPGRGNHRAYSSLHTCCCFQYLQCHASESYELSAHTKSDPLACSDSAGFSWPLWRSEIFSRLTWLYCSDFSGESKSDSESSKLWPLSCPPCLADRGTQKRSRSLPAIHAEHQVRGNLL